MTELGLRWVRYSARGSWHLADREATELWWTYCGRLAPPQEPQAFPPPNQRTCESCFQRRERRAA